MTHSEIIEMISWGFCTLVAIFILLVIVASKYNPLDPDWDDDESWDDNEDWDDSEEQRIFEGHWQNIEYIQL